MKLHIGNLSPKVTENELVELFGHYGPVFGVEIEWTRRAGRSGGVAVVEMNLTEALRAARELGGRALHNRRLYITLMGEMKVSRNFEEPSVASN